MNEVLVPLKGTRPQKHHGANYVTQYVTRRGSCTIQMVTRDACAPCLRASCYLPTRLCWRFVIFRSARGSTGSPAEHQNSTSLPPSMELTSRGPPPSSSSCVVVTSTTETILITGKNKKKTGNPQGERRVSSSTHRSRRKATPPKEEQTKLHNPKGGGRTITLLHPTLLYFYVILF